MNTKSYLAREVFEKVMELFAGGHLQPVGTTTYPISQMSDAFRLIQAGKHTGKIILTVEPEQKVQVLPSKPEVV